MPTGLKVLWISEVVVTIEELVVLLSAEGFRPDAYDLSGVGKKQAYVLQNDHGTWSVFYSERGNQTAKRTFPNESQACEDLRSRLRTDRTTKQP